MRPIELHGCAALRRTPTHLGGQSTKRKFCIGHKVRKHRHKHTINHHHHYHRLHHRNSKLNLHQPTNNSSTTKFYQNRKKNRMSKDHFKRQSCFIQFYNAKSYTQTYAFRKKKQKKNTYNYFNCVIETHRLFPTYINIMCDFFVLVCF